MTQELPDPFKIIAIDGGAASGKSSTARALASLLNFLHVDTGSHYRAIAFIASLQGIRPVSNPSLMRFLANIHLDSLIEGNQSRILINNECLGPEQIRTSYVNATVSDFAALAPVRNFVRSYQQSQVSLARAGGFAGIIMEGRDIGTVILPCADLKVFLSADPSTRQFRRSREGQSEVIDQRDVIDSSRKVAPLRPAPDAYHIDNSSLSLNQVVSLIVDRLRSPSSSD